MKDVKLNYKPNPNSFKNTFCVFFELDSTEIESLTPNYISDSGSRYFYSENGLYRLSNHWGKLANSKWRLQKNEVLNSGKVKLGFANWTDFYPDNNYDLLYYLEFNQSTNEMLYQHKNNPNYDGDAILRNSISTMKRIKTARNILNLTNWAKYFENWDIEDLRNKIIHELIFTNKSIESIKIELYE